MTINYTNNKTVHDIQPSDIKTTINIDDNTDLKNNTDIKIVIERKH